MREESGQSSTLLLDRTQIIVTTHEAVTAFHTKAYSWQQLAYPSRALTCEPRPICAAVHRRTAPPSRGLPAAAPDHAHSHAACHAWQTALACQAQLQRALPSQPACTPRPVRACHACRSRVHCACCKPHSRSLVRLALARGSFFAAALVVCQKAVCIT